MRELVIRQAVVADVQALMKIEETCFLTDRVKCRQMEYLLAKAKACFLVAECKGRVEGYAVSFTPVLPRPARLYSLAVMPECRGGGVAREVLLQMRERLKALGYQRWRLEVDESNQRALSLYNSLGFTVIGRIPDYYENGNTAVRMECRL